jgi:hypothetical protein
MSKPEQLDLARRKALSLRLASAAVLRDIALPMVDERTKASPLPQHLRDRLHRAAKDVRDEVEPWPARLDACLRKVAEELNLLPTQGDVLVREAIDRLRDELAHRLQGISCDECASCCDGQPCNNNPDNDAHVVTKGGFCLSEIRDIFHTCCALVDARYAELGEERGPVRPDEIKLAMSHTHHNNRNGLLIAGHIDGWLDLEGPDNRRSVVVGLTIKDDAFDWPSLCRLPYVLLHELVCHAYQNLRGNGAREGGGPYCTWTEGWMDSLAAEFAKEWFESTTLPALAADPSTAFGHANALFEGRYDAATSGLDDIRLGLRKAARDGRRDLARAIGGADPEYGRATGERFSLLANLQIVDRKTRNRLAQLLAGLVQVPCSTRAKQVANACDCFIEAGDIRKLINDIDALVPVA